MRTFFEAAADAGTDKVFEHAYHEVYPLYLESLRSGPVVLFEIGVAQGKSMTLWREYFPHGEIHGFDHDVKGKVVMSEDVHIVDVMSPDFPTVLDSLPAPDIVIDDGGHWAHEQERTFDVLWPRLKAGGWYFIEDLHAAKLRKYRKRQGLADYIPTITGLAATLLEGSSSSADSVHCHAEICAIHKRK